MKYSAIAYSFVTILFLMGITSPGITQSIDTSNLAKLYQFCDSTKADELLISVNGKIVTHWKRSNFQNLEIDTSTAKPYCQSLYFNTASMVKSWTGMVVGMLIDKGFIKNVDDLVCTYLPDWEVGCFRNITVRDLLTMTAGFNRRTGARGILSQEDGNAYVLNLKPDTVRQVRFDYSNESVQLLGLLIERVTDKTADKVFEELLFEPLGMDSTFLGKDNTGNVVVYGGAITTVQDAHQVGLLMLQRGKFDGKQILSSNWVNMSVTPGKLAAYYGQLWWIDKNSRYWNYAATGDLGQMTIVFPDLDLVIIRRQSCDSSRASRAMSWMGPSFLNLIMSLVE